MNTRPDLPPLPPRFLLILLLAALAAFGPLSIDLYLPALPAIARSLATAIEQVQLTVTVSLGGFCVGMLIYGPLADHFGRRPVLLGGIALFTLASLACMLADNVDMLLAARFVQALGGGAASVLARVVARDIYSPTEAIRMMSLMGMVTSMAPLVAPLLGSAILLWGDWRTIFAALLGWGTLALLASGRWLPETLPRERAAAGGAVLAFAAYGRLLRDPAALGLLLAGGMSFAAMFAYITAGPFYFIELSGLSPQAYGGLFAVNAFGIFLANYANSRLVRRLGPQRLAGIGCLITLLAGLALPLLQTHVGVIGVAGALFAMVGMTGLLGANCIGLLMHGYPRNAGVAAALFGASQFGFGMLASAAVGYFHDGSGAPMAWVMLSAAVLSALGFLLYRACADERFELQRGR